MTASRTRTARRSTPRRSTLIRAGVAGLGGLVLLLPGCAADEVSSGGTPSPSSSEESPTSDAASEATSDVGTVVVGGANFTEMAVMQAMYVAVLEDAGYTTETVTADNREVYFGELAAGNISVVPEYAATLAEFLNQRANGAEAAPIASADTAATLEAARPLAEAQGVVLLEPAAANSQNGFAVTRAFAEENQLTTLSDLAALGQPLVLASTEECSTRPFCQAGLEGTYGLQFTSSLPTGFSTPQTKAAVQSGEAQVGLVGTTDATLGQFDLVLLEDDKGLQLADNLVPAVTAGLAGETALVEALDELSATLSTQDLGALNSQVDNERLLPADVVDAYLQDKGLLDG